MRKLRTCSTAQLNTGVSKCAPDFGKVKGAILVKPGTKLPAELTADELERLVHADRPERIYGIITFVEYAKEGGEVQTSAVGYGPEEVTGLSARKDTFTLDKYYPELYSALTRCLNQAWDVYYFDENNNLYGLNDGTDVLAGIPMSGIYSDATNYETSSDKPSMTVTFCYEDPKDATINFDYTKLDFKPGRLTLGLVPVCLEKVTDNEYKLYEKVGANDVTAEYGPLLAEAGAEVVVGATTAVSYNASTQTLTIAMGGKEGMAMLAAPSVLYAKDIKGIEQV